MKKMKIKNIYSLTPLQEGMLFHHLQDPSEGNYIVQNILEIQGNLNIEFLEKSLKNIQNRHDILRTVFKFDKIDNPMQIVFYDQKCPFYFKDLTHLEHPKEYIYKENRNERKNGFDLKRSPAFKMKVYQTSELNYFIVFSFHHIILDGWCLGTLFSELFRLYKSFLNDQPLTLPKVCQFSEYLKWLKNQDVLEAKNYWASQFKQIVPTPLIDHHEKDKEFREHSIFLNEYQSEELNQLAKKNHFTVNSLFQAIWSVILSAIVDEDSVVFGQVFNNRPTEIPDIDTALGLFINTIPVRVDLLDHQTFVSICSNIQNQFSQTEKYAFLSLSDIKQNTGAQNSLFDHIFVFENYPLDEEMKKDFKNELGFKVVDSNSIEQSHYHFGIVVIPHHPIRIDFMFSVKLEKVLEIQRYFETVIDEILLNPGCSVSELKAQLDIDTRPVKNETDYEKAPSPSSTPMNSRPLSRIEKRLATIWKELLGVSQIHPDDNFFQLGGDSLLVVKLVSRAKKYQLELTVKECMENPTLEAMAKRSNTIKGKTKIDADDGVTFVTPIQQYHLDLEIKDFHRFGICTLVKVLVPLDKEALERATGYIYQHHDALRLCTQLTNDKWSQVIKDPADNIPFSYWHVNEDNPSTFIESKVIELQDSLVLSQGPLFHIGYFHLNDKDGRLFLLFHHLGCDQISWDIILEDFWYAYSQYEKSLQASPPPKAETYQSYTTYLKKLAQSKKVTDQVPHWTHSDRYRIKPFPVDKQGDFTGKSERVLDITLEKEAVICLEKKITGKFDTQIANGILAALLLTMKNWTGHSIQGIILENHGRESEIDIQRTVGWLSYRYPMIFNLENIDNYFDALMLVIETIKNLPQKGLGYGLLRYLNDDPEILSTMKNIPEPFITFNYRGAGLKSSVPDIFDLAPEKVDDWKFKKVVYPHQLYLHCEIFEHELAMHWEYSANLHHQNTIKCLANQCIEVLRDFSLQKDDIKMVTSV
ncbi:hypothetical protein GF406_06435 [candidate division KSB1 bacterium]|nr:hypothetical protein [candidate division KSB1 bacterium]